MDTAATHPYEITQLDLNVDDLSREQRAQATEELLDRAAGSDEPVRSELLEEVVLVNRGVARSVAARYRDRGVPQEDLEQAAYVGLVKAVQRFDPERSDDLLTFAVPTIRGELQRHFRDHGWTVRPPRRVQDLQKQLTDCLDELAQELGHEPSEDEVVDRLDVDHGEYAEAVAAFGCFSPTSLDQPLTIETDMTIGDLVAEEPDAGHGTEAAEARTTLAPVVRELPERDREILYLRFFEEQTQEEIGQRIGVTQMQVSRLLSRILRDLRQALGVVAA